MPVGILTFWLEKMMQCKTGETVYLPIDFSDQYTGCLKALKLDKDFVLNYGFSEKQCAVSGFDSEKFYKETDDFQAESGKQLTVDQKVFISTLEKQIQKLKKVIAQ